MQISCRVECTPPASSVLFFYGASTHYLIEVIYQNTKQRFSRKRFREIVREGIKDNSLSFPFAGTRVFVDTQHLETVGRFLSCIENGVRATLYTENDKPIDATLEAVYAMRRGRI